MAHTLLVVELRSQRDALRARQRARQLGRLLGYDDRQQAVLAAAVFYLAQQTLAQGTPAALHFIVDAHCVHVVPVPAGPAPASLRRAARLASVTQENPEGILPLHPKGTHLCWPLPVREDGLAAADLSWVLAVLHQRTPLNLWGEIQRQNQELLAVHLELKACQKELARRQQLQASEPAA